MTRQMPCAYCGATKMWPNDFPVSHYAKCAGCTEAEAKLTGLDGLPERTGPAYCTRCNGVVAEGIAMSPGIGCSRCVPNIVECMIAVARVPSTESK